MLDLSRRRLNRTILTLAWPAILENLMHTSVYVVDSIFIGSLGTLAFAAVGQSSMILFTTVFVFYGIGVATGAIVARNLGRGDRKSASEAAGQGIILGTSIGLIVASVGLMFGEDLMVLLGTEPDVVALAQEYMPIVFAFSVMRLFIYTSSGVLRAAGDTKTPMWITGIMNVFNIFADWVLIFGIGPFPELGITGAALATGSAYVLGASMLVYKLFRRHAKFRLHGSDLRGIKPYYMRTIVRIALPNVGEQMVMQSAYFSFMWIVTSLGTTAMTAHFMTIRVEMVSFMPVFGLSMAVATIVGQSLGAERPEIAELCVKKAARIGTDRHEPAGCHLRRGARSARRHLQSSAGGIQSGRCLCSDRRPRTAHLSDPHDLHRRHAGRRRHPESHANQYLRCDFPADRHDVPAGHRTGIGVVRNMVRDRNRLGRSPGDRLFPVPERTLEAGGALKFAVYRHV